MGSEEVRQTGGESQADGTQRQTELSLLLSNKWDQLKAGVCRFSIYILKHWQVEMERNGSMSTDLSMRMASVFRSFSSQVSLSSAMIFSDS